MLAQLYSCTQQFSPANLFTFTVVHVTAVSSYHLYQDIWEASYSEVLSCAFDTSCDILHVWRISSRHSIMVTIIVGFIKYAGLMLCIATIPQNPRKFIYWKFSIHMVCGGVSVFIMCYSFNVQIFLFLNVRLCWSVGMHTIPFYSVSDQYIFISYSSLSYTLALLTVHVFPSCCLVCPYSS